MAASSGRAVTTGEMTWQARGFRRSSLLYADRKAIIMGEDCDLVLAELVPEGLTTIAEAPRCFDTTSWSVPTLVDTTLYAGDGEKIVALDLGGP